MTIKEIVSEIARREGKKSQVKVGDIREIVGIISDMVQEPGEICITLLRNGRARAKRKAGKQ